eukprot:g6723.t1
MKAADYRIPWGRPSEHLLAVKREIIGQQLHVQRVRDARNRSTVDTEPPECSHMPHLITRPKKKKMQEDRQREIAAENYSLMHRLAGIMKEERGDSVQKFAHLSVEYRESLRRKKLLKLETENRRLARSIRRQKPFYPNRAMEKEEEERQVLLKTMSRTERRRERVASLKATAPGRGNNQHQVHHHQQQSAATTAASLVEDGVLFRPGPTAVRLRTAKQMQLEVARRRRQGGGSDDDDGDRREEEAFFSAGSGDENDHNGEGGGRGARGLASPSPTAGALTVQRRAYGGDGIAEAAGRGAGARGVVLEVNRTGGGHGRKRNGGGGRRRRAASGDGRPNMIFTPSLVPVGLDSVRARPMTLGNAAGEGGGIATSSVRWEGEEGEAAEDARDTSLAEKGEVEEGRGPEVSRDSRTV